MDSLAAAKKVMLFGDMSKFYVRKVGGPSLFVARERFAPDYGILGYIRFDGVLANTAAVKHGLSASLNRAKVQIGLRPVQRCKREGRRTVAAG
jgi:hypothetical protein